MDNDRLATTLELIVGTETGVRSVRANPITGRILVTFDPATIQRPIEEILRAAIEFGPVHPDEIEARPEKSLSLGRTVRRLATAELGCVLAKTLVFGGSCVPLSALTAVAMLFLFHRHR